MKFRMLLEPAFFVASTTSSFNSSVDGIFGLGFGEFEDGEDIMGVTKGGVFFERERKGDRVSGKDRITRMQWNFAGLSRD